MKISTCFFVVAALLSLALGGSAEARSRAKGRRVKASQLRLTGPRMARGPLVSAASNRDAERRATAYRKVFSENRR